jgi:WD40 repeat protein
MKKIAVMKDSGRLFAADWFTLGAQAHDNEILSLDYSPSGIGGGFLLASGGRDHLVHVYDAQVSAAMAVQVDVCVDGEWKVALCGAPCAFCVSLEGGPC